VPDNDLTLNIAILLVILAILGKTTRGKLLMNNERLQLCFHFLKNPVILNNALVAHDKPRAKLQNYDEYSIASIAKNFDPLHDSRRLKALLQRAASLNLITVEYRKAEGFMYDLSQIGMGLVEQLEGEYYDSLRSYAKSLTHLNSVSTTNLNEIVDNDRGRSNREF
jgi:hypothetical protein